MFLTILAGVAVFVLGQFFLKLVIDPWQKQRECIADIAYKLIYYADVCLNPGLGKSERNHEASIETRKLAAELTASCYRIPMYACLSRLRFFPSLAKVREARRMLTGLSRGQDSDNNATRIDRIRELLAIEDIE
jgi:hypothetical protein